MKAPLDHLRSRKKPVSKRIAIALDSQVAADYHDAKTQAEQLDLAARQARERCDRNRKDQALFDAYEEALLAKEQADAATDAALERLEAESAWFEARSLGPNAWDALVNDHLPTEEQRKKARKDGDEIAWNPDTFPDALVAACVSYLAPDGELVPLTEEFIKDMLNDDQWNRAEVAALFMAAVEVNSTRRVVDMGNASRRNRSS